jgi:hypothetical protein
MTDWYEKDVAIAEIQSLLDNGYEVEVDSPDGWVGINCFINKGIWEEYVLKIDGFDPISCNENHLFETSLGWLPAIQLCGKDEVNYLTNKGYRKGVVSQTHNKVSIVDINVNHENHRYYTGGISSHNTGVGKSLFMCHCAAANITQGKNVLYITMEMAEEKIAERIDANLLNVQLDDLEKLSKDMYDKKIAIAASKADGKLIIKEYPTASASAQHFRNLLNELRLKKSFVPHIIYIDYLNICSSSRIKSGSNVNSYTLIKSIAEELRGLAVEFNVPIVSATQTTRSGYCLGLSTQIQTQLGIKEISDVQVGDFVLSNTGYNEVLTVFPKTKKKSYKITLEDGKEIICSEEHIFPTENGEINIKRGLTEGMKLLVKE